MAVSALGMGTEQSSRVFMALREMLSKGVLASEELVRQWGNALPNAVGRAAKAFGKSQEEFTKALRTGSIRGEVLNRWVVEYARLLREDFEPAAREGAESLQGSLKKMQDAVELLYLEISKGEGFPKLNESIRNLADELRGPGALAAMRELGNSIATAATYAEKGAKFLWEYRSVIVKLGQAMLVVKGVGWATEFAKWTAAKRGSIAAAIEAARVSRVDAVGKAKETAAIQMNIRAILQENIARNEARVAKMMESIASGRVMTASTKEYMARILQAVALDKERLATAALTKTTYGLIVAKTLLGGWMGVTTLAIMGGAAAWGKYKQKQDEAKAAMEESRVRQEQQSKALNDTLLSLHEQSIALGKVKNDKNQYTIGVKQMCNTILEFQKEHPGFLASLDLEGKSYERIEKIIKEANQARLEELRLKADIAKAEYKAVEKTNKELLEERDKIQAEVARLRAIHKPGSVDYWQVNVGRLAAINKQLTESIGLEHTLQEAWKKSAGVLKEFTNKQIIADLQNGNGGGTGGTPEKSKFMSEREHQLILKELRLENYKGQAHINAELQKQIDLLDAEVKMERALLALKKELEDKKITSLQAREREAFINAKYFQDITKAELKYTETVWKEEEKRTETRLKALKAYSDGLKESLNVKKDFDTYIAKAEKHDLDAQLKAIRDEGRRVLTALAKYSLTPITNTQLKAHSKTEKDLSDQAREKAKDGYISKLKEELSLTSKIKGGLSRLDYEETFAKALESVKDSPEALKAMEDAITSLKSELHFDGKWYEGIGYGMQEYLTEISSSFKNFADTMKSIGSGLQNQMSDSFQKIFEEGMTGAEKWKQTWEGMRNVVIKAISDVMAKQLMYLIFGKGLAALNLTVAGTEDAKAVAAGAATVAIGSEAVAQEGLNVTQAGGVSVATGLAAANIMLAHSYIPFVGVSVAAGFIAEMNAVLATAAVAAKALGGSFMAFARGGLVTQPTLALIGETGKNEFVAPEIDFFNWSERLAYNIMRRQDEANAYREYNAGIIQATDIGGMKEPVINNYYNVTGKRELAEFFSGLVDYHKKRV